MRFEFLISFFFSFFLKRERERRKKSKQFCVKCVCVCVCSTSLYAEVTVCPLGRWKRRKLLELLSRHVERITPTYFSVKVSVECFSKSSAAFTNCLYLLRGFIYHFESDHAVCFLHFTCCSVLSHQLWCSVFRQKKRSHLVGLGYARPLKHTVSN